MRVAAWLEQRFRPVEGWFLFSLLILAALSAAVGGMAAGWVPGDELFWHTALVGVLVGRWLGRTRMRWAALLLAVGGAVYMGWWVTNLTPPLWAVLGAAWRKDWPLALTWLQEAEARIAMLTGEVVAWIGTWLGRGGTPGPMVSLFWMALILWGGAAFAGWTVARGRHPLLAFFPLGSALTLSVYLGDAGIEYLLLFMACMVMMTPPMTLWREEQVWESRQVDYSEEFRFDALATALVAVVIFIAVAVTFPNVRVWAIVDWFWQHVQGPQQSAGQVLEQVFPGARPATGGGPWSGGIGAVLPREHLLGGNPVLERTVVMHVVTSDPPPVYEGFPDEEARPQQTFYWRGTVYIEYVGSGWRQGPTEDTPQPPYASLGPPERPGRRPLRQEFTLLVPHGATLYAAGDPHSVDRAVTVRRLSGSDDLVALEGRADDYHVLSLVPQVTARELAEAPATYPPQIEDVYLALPGGLPERVVELAREVTGEVDTPYTRALALEAYLRSFPYALEVSKPPEGRDVVDYFLFELQRGYCDYFASAMVVMARSVGIPARLAVGYAMGSYDFQQGAYMVAGNDAHTWPELYFPDYGWIPFEPTSGFRPLERAEDVELSSLALPSLPERPWWVRMQVEARLTWLRWRWWALAGFAGLLMVGVGWRAWRRRLTGLSGEERVALTYARLRGMASRLGVPVHPWDTPAEFTAATEQELTRRRPRGKWLRKAVCTGIEQSLAGVFLLTKVYEQVSYAPAPPDPALLHRAWQEGRRLHWRLRGLWVLSNDPRGQLDTPKP